MGPPGPDNGRDAAQATQGAGDQRHEVGLVVVAERVDVVQEAVPAAGQATDVDGPAFLVDDLLLVRQPDPLNHVAVRVGLVGLRDGEVDQRLDLGRAARVPLRGGRIDDQHVDDGPVVAAGLQRIGRRRGDDGRIARARDCRCGLAGRRPGDGHRLRFRGQRREVDLPDDVHAVAGGANRVGVGRSLHGAGHHVAVHHEHQRAELHAVQPPGQRVAARRGGRRPGDGGREDGVVEEVQRQKCGGRRASSRGVRLRGGEAVQVDAHAAAAQGRNVVRNRTGPLGSGTADRRARCRIERDEQVATDLRAYSGGGDAKASDCQQTNTPHGGRSHGHDAR